MELMFFIIGLVLVVAIICVVLIKQTIADSHKGINQNQLLALKQADYQATMEALSYGEEEDDEDDEEEDDDEIKFADSFS